jgi:hypothetical protein
VSELTLEDLCEVESRGCDDDVALKASSRATIRRWSSFSIELAFWRERGRLTSVPASTLWPRIPSLNSPFGHILSHQPTSRSKDKQGDK